MQHTEIQDLVKSVVNDLGPMKFTQLAQSMQNYYVYPTLFKRGKMKFKSGTEITDRVLLNTAGAARNVELYENDVVNVADGLAEVKAPFRHTNTAWLLEDHEVEMNKSPNELLDLIKTRREQALIDLAEVLETNYFGAPTSSTDGKTPWGLFYWLVKPTETAAADASDGFNGGNPTGFTDVGGLSADAWKNYTSCYHSVPNFSNGGTDTKGDFIRRLRKAYRKTAWVSPLGGQEYGKTFTHNMRIFCNYATLGLIEDLLESSNDNLTSDVSPLFGKTTFKGVPFEPLNILDSDSDNPVYGVNADTIQLYGLRGFFMREAQPKDLPNNHLVSVIHIDNSYNWVCTDRRRNFVMKQVSTFTN